MIHIDESKIIEWAVNYHRKEEMTAAEILAFEQWLQEDPKHSELINHYRQLYAKSRQVAFTNIVDEHGAWQNIIGANQKPVRRLLPKWTYYAAAVLLALLGTWFMYNGKAKEDSIHHHNFEQLVETGRPNAKLTLANGSQIDLTDNKEQTFDEEDGTHILKDKKNNLIYDVPTTSKKLIYNKIEVPRAGEFSLTLSDGTKVWLNADTQLRYPVSFGNNSREVYLTGEAYFEVAHNATVPFIVHANDTKVKVLGTKFNISSYTDQSFVATTLVEGSVKVDYLADDIILKPGQQSIVSKGKDGISVQQVDSNIYTSWVNGIFEFEDADLEYICQQLGRLYNVNFFFTQNQLKEIRFTGAFKRNQSINYAIDLIEQITNVKFRVEGENIIIER